MPERMSGRSKAVSSMQSLIKKNKNFKVIKQKMDDKTRLKRKEVVRDYINTVSRELGIITFTPD